MDKIKRIRDRSYLVVKGSRLLAEVRLDKLAYLWKLIIYCPSVEFATSIDGEYEAVDNLWRLHPMATIYQISYLLDTKS